MGSSSTKMTNEDKSNCTHFWKQQKLIKDEVRIVTYRNAILNNDHLFIGKTVLHVGCGPGLLPLFTAQAGAVKIVALEHSNIVDYAEEIVEENGHHDKITIIKGRVEDTVMPLNIAYGVVDIIVAEFAGKSIFFENMIESVINARNKWLKPEGIMYPDKCGLFMMGIRDRLRYEDKISYWDNAYGFDMAVLKNVALGEVIIDTVRPRQIATNASLLRTMNLNVIQTDELDFTTPFSLQSREENTIHAFVTFFTVDFTRSHHLVGFSTAPEYPETHWKQAIFYLHQPIQALSGEIIQGMFTLKRKQINTRELDITIQINFTGQLCEQNVTYHYQMRN